MKCPECNLELRKIVVPDYNLPKPFWVFIHKEKVTNCMTLVEEEKKVFTKVLKEFSKIAVIQHKERKKFWGEK